MSSGWSQRSAKKAMRTAGSAIATPSAVAPRPRKPGILDVADDHPGVDVRGRDAVHHHLGAALVHVVMRRQRGEARALEPHLDVAGGLGRDVAQPEQHRPRGGDHDARGSGADARDALASDLARHPHAIGLGRDLRHRRVRRGGAVHEERRAGAVLLEDDLERGELAARSVDRHLERRGDADEPLGVDDLDRRARPPAGEPVGHTAPGGEENRDHDEDRRRAFASVAMILVVLAVSA